MISQSAGANARQHLVFLVRTNILETFAKTSQQLLRRGREELGLRIKELRLSSSAPSHVTLSNIVRVTPRVLRHVAITITFGIVRRIA
jgi:hypothetical protein